MECGYHLDMTSNHMPRAQAARDVATPVSL